MCPVRRPFLCLTWIQSPSREVFFFFSFFYSSIIWSAGYSAAQKKAAEATTEVEKAYAEIELTAYSNMGRALEIAL